MPGSSRLTFRGITRSIFKRLRKNALRKGIIVSSPAGEAVKDGVKIQWNYDPSSELLEVECIQAPFWIDSARISKDLQSEIEEVLGSSRAA
jgi:hypothetical protein